jgi:ABC-type phosphate transport system permease subunit
MNLRVLDTVTTMGALLSIAFSDATAGQAILSQVLVGVALMVSYSLGVQSAKN